jgi:hypothetical protein
MEIKMGEYNYGDTVEITIKAEVIATYKNSDRIKLRWNSGEEIISTSNFRLKE